MSFLLSSIAAIIQLPTCYFNPEEERVSVDLSAVVFAGIEVNIQ